MKLLLQSLLVLTITFFTTYSSIAQCNSGEIEVIVNIIPDNYPNEVSWNIKDPSNTIVASGLAVGDTLCLLDNVCYTFTMIDSYGDGICCAYGNGSYSVSVGGNIVASGSNYLFSEVTTFNCPPGTSCGSAFVATNGNHTAPHSDTWYTFTPTVAGMYDITTCNAANTCDTKIWVYQTCTGLQWDNTNISTLLYDDNNGNCGLQAAITAALIPTETYIIRIGSNNGACGTSPIEWAINYNGPITGCMDPNACNYNPLATVSAGQCYYWPDLNCPGGPDLVILEDEIENSLYLDVVNAGTGDCRVAENCLTGYGNRTVLRFTTWIKNIGDVDYFVGNPTNNPSQFSFVNCHNHAHYEGYAEYILFRNNGNPIPIGFKNGFCVMDLECSGGGTAKFGCSNMGITAQCGDIYDASLECQWIDITDVDPGDYIFAVRINWDQSPDALGRPETDYTNNWAQVCLTITETNGVKGFTVNPNCSDYVDCQGTPFGSEVIDCNGDCGGSRIAGDLDISGARNLVDVDQYVTEIKNNTITAQECTDLNDDGIISVWDAALVEECYYNGTPYNNACVFPHGVTSPNPMSYLVIDNVNFTQNYVDIHIQNPNNFIKGFEFNISGLTIQNVLPMYNINNFTVLPQFNNSGKIIGISTLNNNYLQKNTNPEPFLRVYYSALTGTEVCISEIVHFVNNDYQAILIDTIGGCKQVQFATVDENFASNYIHLTPNPAKDIVSLSAFTSEANATVEITNMMGQVIQTWNLTENNLKLDLNVESYASGVYFVKLHAGIVEKTYKLVKE